jgi:hypothetical protein
MTRRLQIPLYKLFIVVGVYCVFFRVRQLEPAGGDMLLPAICTTIVSLYVLFRASDIVTVALSAAVGAIVGYNAGAVHYKNGSTDVAAGLIAALIGAGIGLAVGFVVIASRKWDAHEKWLARNDKRGDASCTKQTAT